MKKQLVIQSVPGTKHIDNGKSILCKKCFWLVELHYEVAQGIMEIIELNMDRKITLLDVMSIIHEKAEELIPDGNGDCGYRVFRVKA